MSHHHSSRHECYSQDKGEVESLSRAAYSLVMFFNSTGYDDSPTVVLWSKRKSIIIARSNQISNLSTDHHLHPLTQATVDAPQLNAPQSNTKKNNGKDQGRTRANRKLGSQSRVHYNETSEQKSVVHKYVEMPGANN